MIAAYPPCTYRVAEPLPRCSHRAYLGLRVLPRTCEGCPFRGLAVAPAQPQPLVLTLAPCRHRGAVIREERCRLCGDRERVEPVLACAIHGTCTMHRYRFGQAEPICLTCDDATPPS